MQKRNKYLNTGSDNKEKRIYRYDELATHKNFIKWFDIQFAKAGIIRTSFGGNASSPREANKNKQMGYSAGITDLLLRGKGLNGKTGVMWLEFKTPKGSLSKSQKNFKEQVEKLGDFWCVARSLEEAINKTREYFEL